MTTSSMAGTQAIARAAALLREIASSAPGHATLAELASQLQLERPTAHRILQRLVMERLIHQDPSSRCYRLGPLLYELGLAASLPHEWHGLASEEASRLAQETGDTVFAIVPSGLDTLCIDRQEGDYPVKALLMNPGRRRPMGVGAGSLSLLSAMPAEKSEQILQANAHRLQVAGEVPITQLMENVKTGSSEGYVVRVPTDAPEILSISVAVCNAYHTPLLALSISALKFRVEHRQDFLLKQLTASKRSLEKRLSAL